MNWVEAIGVLIAVAAFIFIIYDRSRGGAHLEREFFSKGFHHALTGTNEWASYEIPFYLKRGQQPDLVRLNLALQGSGTVWIRNVQLLKTPLP